MSRNPIDLVREFHIAFGRPVRDLPDVGSPEERVLRVRLMLEEVLEFAKAAGVRIIVRTDDYLDTVDELEIFVPKTDLSDLVQMAHELADIQYVVSGTAVQLGIPINECVAEIHAANMRKLGPDGKPIVDERGKVQKPDGWRPANVARVLSTGVPMTDPDEVLIKSCPQPETECVRRQDRIHCTHWQDGGLCCDCGAPADPDVCKLCGAADGHDPQCERYEK